MRPRIFCSLLLVSIVLAAVACQKQQPQQSAEKPPLAKTSAAEEPAPWRMSLVTDPASPDWKKPTKFRLKISEMTGTAVSGAEVRASLAMTTMDMGKNEFLLADKGNGVYEGEGSFSMAGPWEVIITAKVGDKTGHEKYPVVVKK